jgi:hypothetical protein
MDGPAYASPIAGARSLRVPHPMVTVKSSRLEAKTRIVETQSSYQFTLARFNSKNGQARNKALYH